MNMGMGASVGGTEEVGKKKFFESGISGQKSGSIDIIDLGNLVDETETELTSWHLLPSR